MIQDRILLSLVISDKTSQGINVLNVQTANHDNTTVPRSQCKRKKHLGGMRKIASIFLIVCLASFATARKRHDSKHPESQNFSNTRNKAAIENEGKQDGRTI